MLGFLSGLLSSGLTPQGLIKNFEKLNSSPDIKSFILDKPSQFDIPRIYGTVRLEGNLIWQSNVRHVINKKSSGFLANISPFFRNTNASEITYYQDFALVICEGEIENLNAIYYKDEKLDMSLFKYRFYKGSENQTADPLINTSAFKNICYIVFENFNLTDFGNNIPNLVFEVSKKVAVLDKVRTLVTGMNIIPATGEFCLDTVKQARFSMETVGLKDYKSKFLSYYNYNNTEGKTDALVALDNMTREFPNLQWVSPVVAWFGNSLNIADCEIKPSVEAKNIASYPDDWKVGGFVRSTANLVSKDSQNRSNYGGTIADISLIRYLEELKNRKLKVVLYPMVFLDLPQKPWRGRMTGEVKDVQKFFRKLGGYNEFILHYANLAKGKVDAFIIGSELVGITAISDGKGFFPAVWELKRLAGLVRGILGSGVKISYAADWSEYHHTNGGWYNLDDLWSDVNIDFIGIDAYFPLTPDIDYKPSIEEIKSSWQSGEGWNYYTNWERTEKYPLAAPYAWKNMRWFIENEHWNPNGKKTSWVAKSKKIWFTEYGFPSVDLATNQPNVFFNPDAVDGGLPRKSRGLVDFEMQKSAIIATEEYWLNHKDIVEQKNLWTYDARPYPFFPALKNVWSDGGLWRYGHWVNGKFSRSNLANIISDILLSVGLKEGDFDVSLVGEVAVDGFVAGVNKKVSDLIEFLCTAYSVVFYVEKGVLVFVPMNLISQKMILEDDIILNAENNFPYMSKEFDKSNFVDKIELSFTDLQTYKKNQLTVTNLPLSSAKKGNLISVNFQDLVLNQKNAKNLAERILNLKSQDKYSVLLPFDRYSDILYSFLVSVGGVKFIADNILVKLQENTIKIDGVNIENLESSVNMQEVEESSLAFNSLEPANILAFNLPALPNSTNQNLVKIYIANFYYGTNKAASEIYLYDNREWSKILYTSQESTVSAYISGLASDIKTGLVDTKSELKILLLSGSHNFKNLDQEEFYNLSLLSNLILVGREIIKFQTYRLLGDNIYELRGLIRGFYGTEEYLDHEENETCVLIDENLIEVDLPLNLNGSTVKLKSVSRGRSFSDGTEIEHLVDGRNLLSYPASQISINQDSAGNLEFSWLKRGTNFQYNGWKLIKNKDKYAVFINNKYISTVEDVNFFHFPTSEQIDHFGYILDIKNIGLKLLPMI